MQTLHANILPYQESQSVPGISWKIIFKKGLTTYDLSNRLMTGDPGIIDSADYRQGMTYVNELFLKLNNADGYLTNTDDAGGILDVDIDTAIQVLIYGYFNIPGGATHKLLKYGGWVDLRRLKPSATDHTCEVGIYSYFGKGDYQNAGNITTQYIDGNGLILWSTGLWITDAALAGKVLKEGKHTIETRDESGPQARLDDGPWVALTAVSTEFTLANYLDTERVKIFFYTGYEFVADAVSYIIVTDEGDQYPETFYYYPEIRTIIKEAFEFLGTSTTSIQRYDVATFDDRKVLTLLKTVLGEMVSDAASVVSDGEYKIFLSVVTPYPVNKNQIWYYNYNTEALSKLYECTTNTFTKHRLVYDGTLGLLFAFYSNDIDGGMIQAINISNGAVQTIYSNGALETADVYIRFHYYKTGQYFFFIGSDGIYTITSGGTVTQIVSDANIEPYGMSVLYENTPDLIHRLYYTRNVGGVRKVYYIDPGTPGSPVYVSDFFDQGDYNNYYCQPYYNEDYILMTHGNNELHKMTLAGAFSTISLGGLEIYSLYEHDQKMYCFLQSTDGVNRRIGYIASNTVTIESGNLNDSRLFKLNSNWIVQRQKLCTFKNINTELDLALISNRPGFLFRYSKWITPYIYGEFDYTGKTIRELLQTIANNYLGFIRISYTGAGQYLSRGSSLSNSTLTIKKDFIQQRVRERLYNEKYNGVRVSNGTADAYYGNRAVNAKVLSVDLSLIDDSIVMDMAKYFYDYYQTLRRLHTIKYIPTYFNFDALDLADLSDLGLTTGRIHKLVPKDSSLEISIITEDA